MILQKIIFSLVMMHWGAHRINFVMFLPKTHNLHLIMRKHPKSPNSNGDTVYKITGQYFPKVSRTWKTRKDWGTVTDFRRLRKHENQTQHRMLDWILEQKKYQLKNWWCSNQVYTLVNSIEPMLICWLLKLYCDDVRCNIRGSCTIFATFT